MRYSFQSIPRKKQTFIILYLLTLLGLTFQLDTCSDPKATLYDGYLDTFIYYASFNRDQGSYFKFRNPFEGTANMTSGSIMFWTKLPKLSDDGLYQRGRLFECADSFSARLDNSTIRVNLTQNVTLANGNPTSQLAKFSLDIPLNNTDQLLLWNNFAFSFKDKKLRVHLNGLQVGEATLTYPAINTNSNYCTIGNSLDLRDPFNGYMRHLVFSREGFSANQDITSKIRSIVLPNDPNVLAYFKFEKEFNYQETYYYNSTRNYTYSFTIQYSNEPEQVCYCTSTYPAFLKVSKDYRLKPLDLTPLSTTLDPNGVTLQFWIYPLKLENGDNDSVIFSISSYMDIYLVNKGKNLKVSLYNSTGQLAQSLVLTKYRFKFQFWTLYTIQITANQVILYVDAQEIERATHTVALPTNPGKTLFQMVVQKPTTLSYLLYQISLQDNKKTQTYFNRTFTQPSLYTINSNLAQLAQEGTIKFDSNNQFCNSTSINQPAAFISGDGCKDFREYAYFNNKTTGTGMSTLLRSSMSTITIEMWIKEMYTGSEQVQQVLFENSADNKNTLVQISLLTTSKYAKQVKVVPYLQQQPNKFVTLNTGKTSENWIHLTVISNASSVDIIVFNHTTQKTEQITQDGIVFFGSNSEINTTIGSSINGANKFLGFIKELKIWKEAREDIDLQSYRYTTVVNVNTLMHYFRMNNGAYQSQLYDSNPATKKYFNERSMLNSTVAWTTEKDLVICREGQYFDGQCCQAVSLSNIDVRISYTTTKNFIQVQIVNTTTVKPKLLESIYTNITLVAVGYDYNAAVSKQVKSLFAANLTKDLKVSSYLVNPLLYNLTIQAKVFSLYDKKVVTFTRTIALQCPGFYLQLNSDNIIDGNYYVTNATDGYISITLKTIQNATQCYNPTKKVAEDITISQKIWSHSIKTPTFSNMWSVSSDNYTLTQKDTLKNLNTWNKVSVKTYYNMIYIVENFINLTYIQLNVVNPLYPASSFVRNYVQYQSIDVDLQNSSASNPQFTDLYFQVQCPMSLFTSQNQYNKLCRISDKGKFLLKTTADQSLNIVYNYKYTFNFYIGIADTSVVRNLEGNITFYKDGSARQECPTLIYSSNYNYDKVMNASMEIYPDPYLYCSGKFYEISKVEWTASDQSTGKVLLGIVNQTNSSIVSAFLFSNNKNIRNLVGGSIVNLNGRFTALIANQTSYVSPQQTNQFNRTTQVTLKKNPLVPQIVVQSHNKSSLVIISPLNLGFLENNITLNASSSYDPDNSTAVLVYEWVCPDKIDANYCQKLLTGTRNNSLTITLMQKFYLNLEFNKIYTFKLGITAKDNPYKEKATISFNISFAYPAKDEVAQDMKNTSCEYLNAYGVSKDPVYDKLLEYTKYTWDTLSFSIIMKIDNGQTSSKSPCGGGSVEEQYIYYYLFDGATSNNDNLIPILVQNIPPIKKDYTTQIKIELFPQLQNMQRDVYLKSTVFQFTKRQGSTRIYMNSQTIYLVRRYSPLVAELTSHSIELDQYSNLILNASRSYDSEDERNTKLTYKWTCPNDIQTCKKTTGPILNVTYADRLNNGINSPFTSFEYFVQVVSGNRASQTEKAQVLVTSRDDYSDCIFVTLNNNMKSLATDFEQENRTIFFEYNQQTNIVIHMGIKMMCDNINMNQPVWANPDSEGQAFWTVDTNDKNKISISTVNMKTMIPGQTNTILYSQQISMGKDTATKFQYSTYINIFLNKPDIQPIVNGKLLYVLGQDSRILLNASGSLDPLNQTFSCKWDCPEYFGGQSCSSNCVFNKTLQSLQDQLGQTTSLVYYSDMAHQFKLTITGSDGVRTAKSTQYVYFSNGVREPYNDPAIQECAIKLYNPSQFTLSDVNIYYFSCEGYDTLTDYIANPDIFSLKWDVKGLTPLVDYYNHSGQLVIKPYAAAKLQANKLLISLNITHLNGNRRILQEDSSSNNDGESGQDIDNQNNEDIPPIFNQTDQRYQNDSRIKQEFTFKRETLNFGQVTLTTNDPAGTFSYSSQVNLTFANFQTVSKTNIYFQLRAYQSLYDCHQIIVPIKLFLQEAIEQFYTNTYLPQGSQFYLDFFDINLNYIGSYSLIPNVFNEITLGGYSFNTFDKMVFSITQRSILDYTNDNLGKNAFEQDIKRLLELTELITLNGVFGSNSIIYSNFAQKLLPYLRLNLKTVLEFYDSSGSIQEKRAKLIIQKKVILIFYNLISKNSGIEDKTLLVLDVIDTATQELNELIVSGEDQDFLRKAVLYIQQTLNVQIQQSNVANKNLYIEKAANISKSVLEAEIKQSLNSPQKVISYLSSNMSKTIYKVAKELNNPVVIVNGLNENEKVQFSSEESLGLLNISSLQVLYEKDTNSSSMVPNSVTVNAFDNNSKLAELSFMSDKSQYFSIQLQAKDNISQLIKKTNTNKTSTILYKVRCVYFDTSTNQWSIKGVELESYDQDSGLVYCKTFHLSQFSAQYFSIENNLPQNNQTNNQTNNHTNGNGTHNHTNNLYNLTGSFYEQQPGAFAAALILPLILVIVLIALGFCCKYSGKYDNRVDGKPLRPFTKVYWAVLKIYHPLFGAMFSQQNGTLAIPRVYQILSLWTYVFAIVASTVIDIVYIAEYNYSGGRVVVFAIVFFICSTIVKPICNKIKYSLYFDDTEFKDSNAQRGKTYNTDEQELKRKTNVDRFQAVSQDLEQFEGGDGESEYIDDDNNISDDSNDHKYQIPQEIARDVRAGTNRFTLDEIVNEGNIHLQFESEQIPTHNARDNSQTNLNIYGNQQMNFTGMNHKRRLDDTNGSQFGTNINSQQQSALKNQAKSTGKFQDAVLIGDNDGGNRLKHESIDIHIDQDSQSPKVTDTNSDQRLQVHDDNLRYKSKRDKQNQQEMIQPRASNVSHSKNQPQGPESQVQRSPTYDVPDKVLRSVKKISIDDNDFDKVIYIENTHSYSGKRLILLLLLVILLAIELVITFAIMKKIRYREDLNHWIFAILALIAFFIFILDTIACAFYAIVFISSKVKSQAIVLASYFLAGNPDFRARYSLLLELKE